MVEGSTCNPSLCTWHVAVSRCRSSLAVIQKHPSLPELHREAYKIRDGFPHRKRADQLGRQNLFGVTSLLPYLEKQIIRSSHTQGEQIRYKGMNNEYQEAGITGGYLRGCLTQFLGQLIDSIQWRGCRVAGQRRQLQSREFQVCASQFNSPATVGTLPLSAVLTPLGENLSESFSF